ncbi:YiiX/YebB-like N1pC/P60 family cysteine hydrolase [Shewanella sp. 0m-8]
MKYLLDVTQLKQGDIVLEDGESKVVSEMIKKVTKSNYSHAMLYIDHLLVHAVPEGGVFSKNPQRILRNKKSSFKVLRLKIPVSPSTLELVCYNARAKVGSPYSKVEATKSISSVDKKGQNTKQFCSRLVAQSYYGGGVKLVDNVDYCTPEDINQSLLLEEVLGCVRLAAPEDIDMANKPDPNVENRNELLKWLEPTRKLLKKHGADVQSVNDVIEYLLKDSSTDKRICKYIEATKYLKLYNVDRNLNSYRYNNNEFNAKLVGAINSYEFLISEISLNQRAIELQGKNLKIAREAYRIYKIKFLKLHMQQYCNILRECECRLKVILQYRGLEQANSRVVDALLSEVSNLLR